MAAEDHRGALNGGSPPAGRARPWLGFVALLLGVVLAAAVWVQLNQVERLTRTLQTGTEMVVLDVHQAESEYLRLREQWQHAVDTAPPPDRATLQFRYEIWVSRLGLLHGERRARVMRSSPEFEAALGRVDAFVKKADRLFAAEPPSYGRDALQALLPELHALNADLHEMSVSAALHVSEQLTQRHQALRRHNQVALALTASLLALVLAFAGVAWRQLRQLEERRRSLEHLASVLRVARQDAEAASHAKSTFLANMSHELRTPFQGLLGMLSLLRETGMTPRQIDYLRTATESADHLLALLNDILDMSQLESGRLTLLPSTVDLRVMLREVEALMRPQAAAKNLALHIDAEPGVPERVMLDATRVKQVLFNLVGNAIKFSDQGAVVLDVRLTAAAADGPSAMLEFVVSDTGIGIDAETLPLLFQRFVRADASPARRHGGTGLGLEISRNLARLMGGDITVTSKPGEGSRFCFTVPLHDARVDLPVPLAAGPDDAVPAQALRVLVAEDHPVNRQYLAALLENMGHHTRFAGNGDEAIAAAAEERFDLVLMDLHMPVTDGLAATHAIRNLPDRLAATVPIVALTADAFPETRDRCMVAGMNDFLTKPVSAQKLAATIRRLFGAGAAHETEAVGEGLPAEPPGGHLSLPLLDPVSVATALETMSPQRLGGMLAAFLDQGPAMAQRLRVAVRDGQPLELSVQAHAARGVALNLGLAALASTAQALQDGASHLPAHEVARLVQRFEELIPRSREAAEQAGLLQPAPTPASAPAK